MLFDTGLRTQIHERAPDINIESVILAGATNFRNVVSATGLPKVLIAYATSVDYTFYLGAAAGVLAWGAAWGMGSKDIRKKAHTTGQSESIKIEQSAQARGSVNENKV